MNDVQFEELYKKYYGKIFAYCYAKTKCKDISVSITNDAFLLLYQKQDDLNFDENPDKMIIWLLKTATIKVKEHFRKSKAHITIENLDLHENTLSVSSSNQTDSMSTSFSTYNEYLLAVKEKLNESDAAVFELLVLKNMKQKDAAAQLNITVGALKMKWKRLKPKIEKTIQDLKKD